MSTFARFGRWWERPRQRWYIRLLENIRSNLTWLDLFIGFCATAFISAILIGFRYQDIPEYKVGQIADQDVRAIQDAAYEDTTATNLKRAEVEAGLPSLYQLDFELIERREKAIAAAFSHSREILEANSKSTTPAQEKDLLTALESRVGGTFPSDLLPVLLRQRFSQALESRILKILDSILRDGIVNDRAKFLKDQRIGILVRDGAGPFEHPLTDSDVARDLASAKAYLRQFRLDFSDLSQKDQAVLIRYLEDALFPTLLYRRTETESRRTQVALRVQPVQLQIRQGQTIIRGGEQVTPNIVLQLDALRKHQRPRSLVLQFAGYFLLTAIFVYSIWRYFVFYQTRHRKIRSHMTLVLVVMACELLTMRLATALSEILGERYQRFHDPSVLYYGIPFAFGALLTMLLVDVNVSILSSGILAIMSGLFYGDIALAVYVVVGSLAGIYSVRQYKERSAILKAGLTIGIVNILCLTGLDILRQMPLHFADVADQVVLALVSGALAAALASMFLPAMETIFKIVTDVRLLELSNLNAPILRRLSVEAPGTYHHSLMVATLGEVAAESIGANSLLARVAAYYHDLGKLLKPESFVENQAYGSNVHEDIFPSKSCGIIASHVSGGIQLAKEIGLPQRISDMIPQHHGTRVMTYFYQKARDGAGGRTEEIVESDFRYPGPKPQSREAAIVMMADSVEAASRTLSEPTTVLVQAMIDRLVDDIVRDNQLNECDITLRDVQRVKESFAKILTGIFHHRIDYPGYDFKNVGTEAEKPAAGNSGPEQTAAV